MHGFSRFWIHGFSVRASHPGLLLEDVEQVGPLSLRGARHRRRSARAGAGAAPGASRRRACRRRLFFGSLAKPDEAKKVSALGVSFKPRERDMQQWVIGKEN